VTNTKITKDELRTPDAFLTYGRRAAAVLVKNQTFVVGLIVLVLMAGLGYIGVNYMQSRRERIATTALYPVEKSMNEDMEKGKALTDGSIKNYLQALKENSGSRAAMVSFISTTPYFLKSGKSSVAFDMIKNLTYSPSTKDIQFGLFKMTQGLLAFENHKYDEALALYQDLLKIESQKTLHPEALLKSGLVYQIKNDPAKAREIFNKVHREYMNTEAGSLALQYLLYLDSKKGA
jgi:tetratricopeptide (TPR) repeat protein